ENAVRDFFLGEFGKREIAAVAREERDDVGVELEACAFGGHVVGYDQVGVFGDEFFARVFCDVISFGGETDNGGGDLVAANDGQNVDGWFKREMQSVGVLLNFGRGLAGWAIVRDGCSENGDRRRGKTVRDGAMHVFRGAYVHALDTGGRFKSSGAS